MKDPLVGPLAAVAAGILLVRFVPFRESELLLPAAAFLALASIALLRRARWLAALCGCLVLLCAGAFTALRHRPGPAPVLDAESREVVILEGCVVEPPAISDERARFLLELAPGARAQVTLYTRDDEPLPALHYGQKAELAARVRKAHNFGNPGAFDYARYLGRQDIYWTASGSASEVRILPGRCGSPFQKAVMDLRQAALARIERLYSPDAYRTGMLQAILIGQSYQLEKVWTEQYRSTGTFHALVISGTHVAVLAGFFLFLLRICFVPEALAGLLTALAAWSYALVTGWQTPCVRSAAGLTLFLIAGYFYRRRRPINLLAAIALAYLLLDPDQLYDASFQLTFLAVAFLGAFAAPAIRATSGPLAAALSGLADTGRDLHLEPRAAQFRIEMRLLAETLERAARLPRRLARWVVAGAARAVLFVYELVLVSAIVQLGLALPMIFYFHRVGVSGLSANVFIVPLIGIVVPVGFIAVFTGWWVPAAVAGALLSLSQSIVNWHAALEPNWRIPTPPAWLAVALGASLVCLAAVRGKWWRAAAAVAAAAFLVLLFWEPFAPEIRPGVLEFTIIDVGQGDSLLLAFPDGRTMLVDGGGIPVFGNRPRSRLEIGEDVVAPYLWDRHLAHLDIVAMTHAHEDHAGGLAAIVSDFHPRELWTGATPEGPVWETLRQSAARAGTRIVPLVGPRRFDFAGVQVEVLAPLPDYQAAAAPRNNDSLVLRVRFGRHSFLLTGDIERQIEWGLLGAGELSHTDVLKVAHHGSRTSTTEEFLDAVSPAFAIVSSGEGNSYGHPNLDVLDRLAARHTALYRTDRNGLVTFRSDGRHLTIDSMH